MSETDPIRFYGQEFARNPEVSEFALMEFAEAASAGTDSDDLAGMAALLRFAVEVVGEKDRARFRSTARTNKASSDDLIAMLTLGVAGERPTEAPSDSSGGRTVIEPKSAPSSVEPVTAFPGRPDLQLVERMINAA